MKKKLIKKRSSPKITVEVCTRLTDCWYLYTKERAIRMPKYHACIRGKLGSWGEGQSIDEAIESLKNNRPTNFKGGVREIVYLGTLAR